MFSALLVGRTKVVCLTLFFLFLLWNQRLSRGGATKTVGSGIVDSTSLDIEMGGAASTLEMAKRTRSIRGDPTRCERISSCCKSFACMFSEECSIVYFLLFLLATYVLHMITFIMCIIIMETETFEEENETILNLGLSASVLTILSATWFGIIDDYDYDDLQCWEWALNLTAVAIVALAIVLPIVGFAFSDFSLTMIGTGFWSCFGTYSALICGTYLYLFIIN